MTIIIVRLAAFSKLFLTRCHLVTSAKQILLLGSQLQLSKKLSSARITWSETYFKSYNYLQIMLVISSD
ncbi:hypothetical protein DPMN_120003 [Dreissena polymorpha]|uniref:Uncharacterized protein n=1 Tax=Dreissena polymorpha TaxID=45954 RepID=A0A9D4GK84_DREPO|nr:hypothetical protein DPMN_120003 [Dreissena polymorpha]